MKRLGDIHFAELLPDSIRHDPTISAAAETLNQLLRKTTLAIPNLLIWARLERDSAALIPPLARLASKAGGLKPHTLEALELLAWQLHVDFRDVATDEAMLERFIRESIPWHRLKGTPAAVERALAMYGIAALVDECGRGGNWAVYELELGEAPDLVDLPKIVRLANEAAPVRSTGTSLGAKTPSRFLSGTTMPCTRAPRSVTVRLAPFAPSMVYSLASRPSGRRP